MGRVTQPAPSGVGLNVVTRTMARVEALLFCAPLSCLLAAAPALADTAVDPVPLTDPADGAAPAPLSLRRFALVAGVNLGGHARTPLRYAVSDAREVADVFGELGGVAEADVALLENPNVETLLGTLAGFGPRMLAADGSRVELIVYYSGHSDEAGLLLGEERLGYRELKDAVDALPADVRIMILDSCSSGSLTRLKGGLRQAPFLVDVASDVKGHAFLTSASADEAAQESDRIGGSFFTHYLVSGLRGAADSTRDGRVTLSEAYQYAFHETLRRTETTASGAQHANYDIHLTGSGDLVMTDLQQGAAGLTMAADLSGRVFVRRGDGSLLAEVHSASEQATRLSLPPGAYDVRLENQEGVWGTSVTVAEGEEITLERGQLERVKLEPTVARGGPSLVAAAQLSRDYEDARLREGGETMLYGGAATAAVGLCCTTMAAPTTVIAVLVASSSQNFSDATPCIATAGTCTVLGVLFAAFGMPVAWLGFSRLDALAPTEEDGEGTPNIKTKPLPASPPPPPATDAARLGVPGELEPADAVAY